ncbi:MAG: hypothetical protein IKD05_06295 [Tidjanibacter sp.]|nr:hypothetical protein [Tidjanibacter sp.]
MNRLFRYIAIAVVALCGLSCSEQEPAREKPFHIYDRMKYPGKPDLSEWKLSPLELFYESALVTDGEVDHEKVAAAIAKTKESGVLAVSTDIESWYWASNGRSEGYVKEGLKEIFDAFKAEIPNVRIGNYGVPIGSLCILRYVESMKEKSEEEKIARWKRDNNRLPAGEVCDVLYPCFYAMTPDMEQWEKDLATTVAYIKEHYPDKEIVGYLWPQYYDWSTSPYYMQVISEENFLAMLEASYKYLDGVVLWAHGRSHRDYDSPKIDWTDERIQGIWRAIQTFVERHDKNIELDTNKQ